VSLSEHLLQAVTDFGDSEVLSLATLAATAVLFCEGERRAAARFFLTMCCTAVVIGIGKIIFLGCGGSYSERLHISSPSGHTALTTAFCIATATQLSTCRSRALQFAIWFASAGAIFSVSVSRVLLGYHSKPEVALGFLVGCATAWVVRRSLPLSPTPKPSNPTHLAAFIAAIVAMAILFHGRHFPAERVVRFIAGYVHEYVPICRAEV
jgi:membrane-associated phospholipid phosphatase